MALFRNVIITFDWLNKDLCTRWNKVCELPQGKAKEFRERAEKEDHFLKAAKLSLKGGRLVIIIQN